MSSEQRLQQITNEMRGLCAELEKSGSLSEEQQEKVCDLCGELDTEFGHVTFGPEVPEATQEMFFRLVSAGR